LKSLFSVGGGCTTVAVEEETPPEAELRTEELDVPVPELLELEEDEEFCVPELLEPTKELDDPCESVEGGGRPEMEEDEPPSTPLPCSDEEEVSPGGRDAEERSPGTDGEERSPSEMEEDESAPCTSWVGSLLLQAIRKKTAAAIAGRTLRFIIRFINTSRW
jgi:hypothetical protein